MKKITIKNLVLILNLVMISFSLHASDVSEVISVSDLQSYLDGRTIQGKIDHLNLEEKRTLKKSFWGQTLPEVSLFGGIKSHQQELEVKENHYLGVRSTYTLFDGGEKKLEYNMSHLNLRAAEVEKNTRLSVTTMEVLSILIKEMTLAEKKNFLSEQQKKLKEALTKSKEKVRAGVLSSLDLLGIEVKVKELENLQAQNEEELGLVLLEKKKKLFSKTDQLEKIKLKEDLDQVIKYLKENNLSTQLAEALTQEQNIALTKMKMTNDLDRSLIKPEVKLFLEKGLTRKIDGEFLEAEEEDRLVFGLEFELPLVHETGKNFQESYAARTRQKILELESEALSSNLINNKETILKLIENKEKSLQRQSELGKLKLNELGLKQKAINSGLVEFPDYVESLVEWIEVRLAELKKKEDLAQAFLKL